MLFIEPVVCFICSGEATVEQRRPFTERLSSSVYCSAAPWDVEVSPSEMSLSGHGHNLDSPVLDGQRSMPTPVASAGSEVAEAIRRRVREETRLTCSVGVAPNRALAKVGTMRASALC